MSAKDQKKGTEQLTSIKTVPFKGGCNTVLETQQIPMGGYSMVQNFRDTHPGKVKRKGQRVQHATADSTNIVMTMYQFNKTRIAEKHFFAQMSDSDVLEADTAPPGVDSSVFGAEVFSGTASPVPASWATIKDALIFSNGVDQHQIYYGSLTYVDRVIHYKSTLGLPSVPEMGYDYSDEAADGLTTTKVILDSFGPIALANNITAITKANPGVVSSVAHGRAIGDIVYFAGLTQMTELNGTYQTVTAVGSADLFSINDTSGYSAAESTGGATGWEACSCVLICCPVPANGLKFTLSAPNGTASVAKLYYRKSTDVWTELTSGTHTWVDGTISSAKTLGATGTMAWVGSSVVGEIPMYMYGQCGFWYMLRVSTVLDVEVEATAIQFTSAWQSMQNVWDGIPVPVVEVQFYDASATTYKTFGAYSIEIDSATTSDKIYFSSSDPINAIYVDVGSKPNTSATTTVAGVYYWNGIAFGTVGTISDGTNGLRNSGWITFARTTAYKTQFNENRYYNYWYYIAIGVATLNDDVIISLYTQPYFDINAFGKGYCNTAWKGRVVLGTDRDQFIYVSALGRPQVLNGDDFGPLEPGDGRSNLPVAMEPFNNELMVWQEEKGKEGGCITLFEGFSPLTWGRLILSVKLGTLSAKTVVVIDGIYTSTSTDEVVGKIAFFLSHYGFYQADGSRDISGVSDQIQNYFDPLKAECIRRGYEDQMWVGHDTAYNVIRVGLVSGVSVLTSTATATTTDKLIDSAGAFTTRKTVTGHPISHTIAIGDTVYNTTDSTSALITAVDSATALSLDTNIMASGEGYEIYSATCNLFPVLDPVTKEWSFDLFQQNPSCFTEVEAGSGNVNIIQMVGGTKDGFVYQSNYGDDDVSTAINSYIDIELNSEGREITLDGAVITAKAGTALAITPTVDGTAGTTITETALTNVRNRYRLNSKGMDMKLRVQNNTASESLHLFGIGLKIYSDDSR